MTSTEKLFVVWVTKFVIWKSSRNSTPPPPNATMPPTPPPPSARSKKAPQTASVTASPVGKRPSLVPIFFVLLISLVVTTYLLSGAPQEETNGKIGPAPDTTISIVAGTLEKGVSGWWWLLLIVLLVAATAVSIIVTSKEKGAANNAGYYKGSRMAMGGVVLIVLANMIFSAFWGELYTSFFADKSFFFGVHACLLAIAFFPILWGNDGGKKRDLGKVGVVVFSLLLLAAVGWKTVDAISTKFKGSQTPDSGIRELTLGSGISSSSRNWRDMKGPDQDSVNLLVRASSLSPEEQDSVIRFIACESEYTQYSDSTRSLALRGKKDSLDRGAAQINIGEHPHLKDSVETLRANVAAAIGLFQEHGSTPWAKTRGCWGNGVQVADTRLVRTVADVTLEAPAMASPTDTVWSDTVFTRGRGITWDPVGGGRRFFVKAKKFRSATIQTFEMHPERDRVGNTIDFYPEWVLFAASDRTPFEVDVTLHKVIR